jgi:hypothetical protein
MLLIIATSVVTTITAISMAAISTNGEIKGGASQHKNKTYNFSTSKVYT